MTPTVMNEGRTTWRLGAGALILGALGCSADAAPCDPGEPCELAGQVQVATWWGTRGELYVPFNILKESLRRTTTLDASLAHELETKDEHMDWVATQLDASTLAPEPLDVFSANNGDEVLRWTPCAASGAALDMPRVRGLTQPTLGFSALDAGWIREHFPREVMETLECEGETYALPVGIHRINTLVYNKRLFADAGYAVEGYDVAGSPRLPLPRTLDELHAAAEALKPHLPEATPGSDLEPSVFAVAGREPWTLSLFVIENLMLSLADSAQHYKDYWLGVRCDESLLARTLDELARLEPWFGSSRLGAADALDRVSKQQAAMLVMGDWAAAENSPDDIGTMPFPGTERYFVFSADVFALPDIASADPGKGLAWLRAVTGESTQREFSAAKRALAARTELEGELAPGGPNAPEWVRSLPAILPNAPEAAFIELQNQLQLWLSKDKDTAELLEYAREEYLKLSHGNVACTPVGDGNGGPR
jgi:ABC-type glycerol-3-phosphate transport system substrate-binding protein